MNWFKNLNAAPRLMLSFGVLLVLTLGISYLGVSALSNANDRVRSLYQEDMKGVMDIENISTNKLDMARQDRDAMVNIEDAATRTADVEALKADFVDMHANVQAAEGRFTTKEEQAAIGAIRDILPEYQKEVMLIVDAISAKDLAGAKAKLIASGPVAAQMLTDIERARQVKEAGAEEKFQANNAAYQSTRTMILGAVLISMLLGIVLSYFIARGFSVPLAHTVDALEKIAAGDLTVALDVDTQDEVGRMAAALNRAVQKLGETLQDVAESAANASSSSQQLAAASEAIASGAQEQAASLEETSASLEEITAAVRQSADNAMQASQLAGGSKDSALQGQEVVSKAITAMAEINVASAKISDIISTIDEIAFQTNLLAVNAAVEAARAGEEGRGFAVVASEVRSLAQRSAVAAKEIKGLIQDSLRKVDAGSALVNRSGETLQGIVGSVKRVTDIVGEIAAASGEQSAGIEQVNTAMTQMDQVTQSNSAQTEELSATAEALSEQATHLLELIGTFTLNNAGGSERDRKAVQHRAVNAANAVQQMNSMQQSHSGIRPSAHAPRRGVTARRDAISHGGKQPKGLHPALASAAPGDASSDDASFQEF
jgi:methyl-accepting chemotaxis protein